MLIPLRLYVPQPRRSNTFALTRLSGLPQKNLRKRASRPAHLEIAAAARAIDIEDFAGKK